MDLTDLAVDCHGISVDHGWWPELNLPILERNKAIEAEIPAKLCLIHSEVSEALEDYRDSGRSIHNVYYSDTGKPEGFGIELADVVIRVFDLACVLGLDIEDLIRIKMAYNKTRPYRHGGKKV